MRDCIIILNEWLYVVCTFHVMLCTCLVKTFYGMTDNNKTNVIINESFSQGVWLIGMTLQSWLIPHRIIIIINNS